jgi:putative phosphoesterase
VAAGVVRVGVISDTHGLLRPEALAALRGSALILHAGDVGAPEVIARLEDLAPTVAVRGNNDTARWARRLPAAQVVRVGAGPRRFRLPVSVARVAVSARRLRPEIVELAV